MMMPTRIRTKYLKKVAILFDAFIPILVTLPFVRVVDPLLLAGECNDRQDADDDEHDPCQSGCHTHVIRLECVVVDQQRDQRGGTTGAAVGDDVGAIELLESLADLSDQIVEDDGGDHRNGDGEELTPLAGTINGSGFVQVCRHALQSGQKQHHGGTKLPDTQEADDPQRVAGVRQPLGALHQTKGDSAQHGVEQAVHAEHSLPQNGDCNRAAQNGGNVVHRTEQVDACDFEVQDVCDEQRKDQLQRHGDESVLEGDEQRLGDLGGGKGRDVVGQTNELGAALEEVHIGEAVVQRLTEGNCLKDDEADDPGDQIKQTLIFVQPLLERGAPDDGSIAFFHLGNPPF